MSAIHHLPQRHPPISPRSSSEVSSRSPYLSGQTISGQTISGRPSIADRLSQLLHEIEAFLLACTHEEMCKFWKAIAKLRHCLQNSAHQSEVPQFLTERRKHRDFCRILEVLADLPYPKLHLSSNLSSQVSDRSRFQEAQPYSAFGYPHKSFNASLN
jgi:hypothetical protein